MQQATYKIITIASPEGDPLQRSSASTTASRNTGNSRSSGLAGCSAGEAGLPHHAAALASAATQQGAAGSSSAADAGIQQPDAAGGAEPSTSESFDPRCVCTAFTLERIPSPHLASAILNRVSMCAAVLQTHADVHIV